ncbi:ATP-binding cassette domain-containing protein [Sphingobium aromaticiconvertens]|uniref:ATP-binding cassette domain-containing protein n=1 Tax=Sphingobium aromaticiconvertens TaxID=365341 RepID=UPI0030198867
MSFEVDVTRKLGEKRIALAFEAGPGITALCGPSGAGKTSILNMIAGLLKPDRGYIAVEGALLFDSTAELDVPAHHRGVGYVFQDVRLFPHMRVRANLRYGGATDAKIAEMAAFLGIDHLLDRWPQTLSGGEAQRVAIGRALLREPKLLLMDEPLSALDRTRRDEILGLMERMRDSLSLPILYVTHDRAEAERLAARIVEMPES